MAIPIVVQIVVDPNGRALDEHDHEIADITHARGLPATGAPLEQIAAVELPEHLRAWMKEQDTAIANISKALAREHEFIHAPIARAMTTLAEANAVSADLRGHRHAHSATSVKRTE